VKAHLIPPEITPAQVAITYATEADLLNVALFGQTARQWRDANPKLEGNVRDYAGVEQLLVLANMEGMNAEFLHMGLAQGERLKRLITVYAVIAWRIFYAISRRTTTVAADILPAVEPGLPARRIKRTHHQSRWRFRESLNMWAFFPGGRMRALHVRQDARRYIRVAHPRSEPQRGAAFTPLHRPNRDWHMNPPTPHAFAR